MTACQPVDWTGIAGSVVDLGAFSAIREKASHPLKETIMKNRQILPFALAVGESSAFVALLAAHAEGPFSFAPIEAGVVYHLAEAGAAKSNAQVASELATARTIPNSASMLRWGSMGTPKVGLSKTRAEVVAELEAAQKQPNWDTAARLGVSLATPKADASKALAALDVRTDR